MTMLMNTQPRPRLRMRAIVSLARLRRLVNAYVAAFIAHRERQATLYALRSLDDRALKDIGVYGCQTDDTIEAIARQRARRRPYQL
jgi:uncharacterized protein YjiS (DUF1127 family)